MDNKTNLKIKKYNMIMWSFLGAVSLIILVLIFQKKIIAGLTTGGVKE